MADSEQLRIYKTARELEDQIYELVKTLPADEFYGLGNELRRSSAAVSHHVTMAHKLYSYRLKMDELAAARREALAAQTNLDTALKNEYITPKTHGELVEGYTNIIKQSWGITKWLLLNQLRSVK